MDEKYFWNLIQSVYLLEKNKLKELGLKGIQDFQYNIMANWLKTQDIQLTYDFHNILIEKLKNLYKPAVAELFLITSYDMSKFHDSNFKYLSTDGFLDFRSFIVGLGKGSYYKFLNFKKEDEISINIDGNFAFREDLTYLAEEICSFKNESESDLNYDFDNDTDELYSKIEWYNLHEKYPKLYKKYQSKFNQLM